MQKVQVWTGDQRYLQRTEDDHACCDRWARWVEIHIPPPVVVSCWSGLSQIKQKQMTLGLLCSKSKKIHLNVSFQKSWPGYWRYPTNLVVSGFTKDDFFFHPRKVPIAKRINLVGGSTIIKFLIYEHKCVFQPGDGTNMILQAWLHAQQGNLSIFSGRRSFEELIRLLHSAKEERSQTSHRRKLVCGLFCLHTITSSWTEWVEPQCAFLLPKAN